MQDWAIFMVVFGIQIQKPFSSPHATISHDHDPNSEVQQLNQAQICSQVVASVCVCADSSF